MNQDPDLSFYQPLPKTTPNTQWVQYGIPAAVVLVATIAAYWGSLQTHIILIGLIVAIAGGLFVIRNPNISYLLVFAGGMFVPFAGPGGTNISILLIILMVILWLIDMFVVRREFKFVKSRTLRPPLYFMLVSVIALGMGQISWFVFAKQAPLDAQLGGFSLYFFSAAAMVMTANIVTEIKWLKAIVWTFVGLGFIYVIGRAVGLDIVDSFYQNGVIANSMFWLWLAVLPMGQAIFNPDLRFRTRMFLYGIVAATMFVAVVINFDWKSGFVPAVVAIAVLIGLRFPKLALLSIPFALLVAIYLSQELIATDQYSWGTRLDAWLVVLDIARISPILGMGFANYYWYATLFSIRGYHITFNSHSQFVDLIAQTGIVGFGLFIWILAEVVALAWKLSRRLTDGFARGYAFSILAGTIGCIVASFLVDWLLPFVYNIGMNGFRASILPWIFFGGLVALGQIFPDANKTS